MNTLSIEWADDRRSRWLPVVVTGTADRSFDDLYRRQFAELTRLAVLVGTPRGAAEDVVQDAFARLYLRYATVERPEAYLRRCVVNGSISRFRRHRREELVGEHADDAEVGSEPTVRLDLERRLAALPPRQRAVVVLRVHLGLSEVETAEVLGCRPGTVGSLLHRALHALRISMEGDDAVDR